MLYAYTFNYFISSKLYLKTSSYFGLNINKLTLISMCSSLFPASFLLIVSFPYCQEYNIYITVSYFNLYICLHLSSIFKHHIHVFSVISLTWLAEIHPLLISSGRLTGTMLPEFLYVYYCLWFLFLKGKFWWPQRQTWLICMVPAFWFTWTTQEPRRAAKPSLFQGFTPTVANKWCSCCLLFCSHPTKCIFAGVFRE